MNIYQRWCIKKAKIKLRRLLPYLDKKSKILDIGCGNGALALLLKKSGFQIETIDIKNKSAFDEIKPKISDGTNLPYTDKYFETAIMITMLHHTSDPETLINEAKRVAKKLIIIEDIYTNVFQKYLTFAADSINNLEFIGHPHSNKNDTEWKILFKKNNLTIETSEYYQFLIFFKQVTYILY
jgi:2-polyprenyl-3-methyl-5-hydroxy-6-metoxy-1,4-benzoquinol methylase